MALKKIEKPNYTYLSYSREHPDDLLDFRRETSNDSCKTGNHKDLIVDLSSATSISSAEISLLVRVLKSMSGTQRFLRLITPPHIKRIITSSNLHKLNHLHLYEDMETLVSHLTGR